MFLIPSLGRRIARRLRRAPGPLGQQWHRRTLRRANPTRATRKEATEPWRHDPQWFPGGTPPRSHNQVTPLIDGHAFFDDLSRALAAAQHYVYIIGWYMTPAIPLQRGTGAAVLATRLHGVLAETAQRLPVRVLLWSGAPFLFKPDRHAVDEVKQSLEEHARTTGADLLCELDNSARFSHCHHQKAIVIDGQLAFVGGMDLTTLQGDRWDLPGHPLRAGINWHDVQLRLEGEAVADVERNFRQRWQAVSKERLLPSHPPTWQPDWQTTVQIVRTIPHRVYDFAPHGEYGIQHVYLRAIEQARRLIYLENQYLWSPEVGQALIDAMNRQVDSPFRIVIVLPARAYDGKDDNDKHVEALRKADKGRGIVSVYCPYASGPNSGTQPFTYRPTYVHAKVGIFDDEWLLIGSANLNDRGLLTDSEIVAVAHDAVLARRTRIDLWTEHLALPREQVEAAEPHSLVDGPWAAHAARNARIIQRGDRPLLGALHRYEPGRMPGSWFLDDVEALLVEH
ncbi:MAG TPA: phospholipase D family protein [Chloroflexota bacterium]|nr:phospholipase D family protein [Chloroflexota bacterium]